MGSASSAHGMRTLANCSVCSLFTGKTQEIKSVRLSHYTSKHNHVHNRKLCQFGFDEENRSTVGDTEERICYRNLPIAITAEAGAVTT